VVEVSAWEKASKIRPCFSAGMPTPVSCTLNWMDIRSMVGGRLDDDADAALEVNLMPLEIRLIRTWRSRCGSPTRLSGTSGATCDVSSRSFSAARCCRVRTARATQSRRLKSMCSKSSLPASIFEKSRMSLMMPRRALAELFTRVRYSRCSSSSSVVQGQVGHAQDGVHGGADLVTHVGEEVALGAAVGFGGFLGLAHDPFGLLALADIPQVGGDQAAAGAFHGDEGHFHRKFLAVAAPIARVSMRCPWVSRGQPGVP
jgi:hypothetical protein